MKISIPLKVEIEHGRKHDTIYLTQLCNWHFTFQKKSVKNCNHHRLNQMPDQRKTLTGCRLYHFVNVCCFANMQFQMMIKSPVNKWGLYVKKSQIAWTSLKWIVTWNKYLEIVLLFEKHLSRSLCTYFAHYGWLNNPLKGFYSCSISQK